MKVLVACEEPQRVCTAFRARGHEAYSCDIIPCSGGHPEWHIQADALEVAKIYWDMMIAFPPCTDLAVSGSRWFSEKRKDGRQQASINFFLAFTSMNHIPKIAAVVNYFNSQADSTDKNGKITGGNVYIVWMCKSLQNWKALLSTDVPDGMYYEATYNGDKGEMYLDAYKKWKNIVVEVAR